MATAQPIDQAKQEAFVNKVLGDTSATMTTILASIGDRLGLFRDLAANGPATSAEVASRTGTNERYVREWLGGMAAAGYVEYDPATSRFTLPAEHAAAVATEGGPFFFGGIHQMLPALVAVVEARRPSFLLVSMRAVKLSRGRRTRILRSLMVAPWNAASPRSRRAR